MNILFMGTPDIAAAALEAILDAGHTVCGVYTRADKPVGRKQVLRPRLSSAQRWRTASPCFSLGRCGTPRRRKTSVRLPPS